MSVYGSPASGSPSGSKQHGSDILPTIYQVVHSNIQYSTPAGSAEIDTWILQIIPGANIWKVRIYALVDLILAPDEAEGEDEHRESEDERSRKGGKGRKGKVTTKKEEQAPKQNEFRSEKQLGLWKSYVPATQFGSGTRRQELYQSIVQGHNNIKRKMRPGGSKQMEGSAEQLVQCFAQISVTLGYELLPPLTLDLGLVSPHPGISEEELSKLSAQQRKQTPGPDLQGHFAMTSMVEVCAEMAKKIKVASTSVSGKLESNGRGSSAAPETPAKRKRPRPNDSPVPQLSLEEENADLKRRLAEALKQLKEERRAKSALASGYLPSEKPTTKATAAKKGASLLQPGVKASRPVVRGFVDEEDEEEWD